MLNLIRPLKLDYSSIHRTISIVCHFPTNQTLQTILHCQNTYLFHVTFLCATSPHTFYHQSNSKDQTLPFYHLNTSRHNELRQHRSIYHSLTYRCFSTSHSTYDHLSKDKYRTHQFYYLTISRHSLIHPPKRSAPFLLSYLTNTRHRKRPPQARFQDPCHAVDHQANSPHTVRL